MGDKPEVNILWLEWGNLFELELDRIGIHAGDRGCYILPNVKGIVSAPASQVDEQTVSISINNLGSPVSPRMYYLDGL